MEPWTEEMSLSQVVEFVTLETDYSINVTDMNDSYCNVSLAIADSEPNTYHFQCQDVMIYSCDLDSLMSARDHLECESEIIHPIEYEEYGEIERCNGHSIGRTFCIEDEDCILKLPYNYDPKELEAILSESRKSFAITSDFGVIIREPVFVKCNATRLTLHNVSLSKEARESIPHLKQLNLWQCRSNWHINRQVGADGH